MVVCMPFQRISITIPIRRMRSFAPYQFLSAYPTWKIEDMGLWDIRYLRAYY